MTQIYHITHVDNLAAILGEGGLVCDREAHARGLCSRSIAYEALKARRSRRPVETMAGRVIAAAGTLADYVPFYFTNRSPMLYAIHRGQVAEYQGGQEHVIYLVSSVSAVAQTAAWCFTDGHAVEHISEFYDNLDDLGKVDWNAIETWRWGGRWLLKDPDIKRRKQAEFLVHGRLPWELIEKVSVINRMMATRVAEILKRAGRTTPVTVVPNWYYNT
jgi:hypothetical protein